MKFTTARAVLSDAFNRCRWDNMRTPEIFAALCTPGNMVTMDWPFRQFCTIVWLELWITEPPTSCRH